MEDKKKVEFISKRGSPGIGTFKICLSCGQLGLKLVAWHKGDKNSDDPQMKEDIWEWRCSCGNIEYA